MVVPAVFDIVFEQQQGPIPEKVDEEGELEDLEEEEEAAVSRPLTAIVRIIST